MPDPVRAIVAEIAGVQRRVAGDLVELLSAQHSGSAIREGREDPYGPDTIYECRSPDDFLFKVTWEKLCEDLRSTPTLFSAKPEPHQRGLCEEMLSFIFGDLDSHVTDVEGSVIREIGPGDEDAFVWRARAALSEKELEDIIENPSKTLSSPPPTSAKAGRMNIEGNPVFYGAMDEQTCVSEVRAPVGAHVVVGRLDYLRPVRLLDVDALSDVYPEVSYFDRSYYERNGRAAFLSRLAREISRPVTPKDEASEYLPTQAVAEFLANNVTPPLDGIIFLSSQTGGDGSNVVLFNHARRVEPYNFPKGTSVEVLLPSYWLPDPYEKPGKDIFVLETVPSNSPGEDSATGGDTAGRGTIQDFTGDEPEELEDGGEPTLRLDPKSIRVLTIEAVTYTTTELYVSRIRQTEEERDAFSQHSVDPD